MNVARSVERFLEQAIDRFSGKIFPGKLQPVELTSRLIREADLALQRTPLGPIAQNHFTVGLHPTDLPADDLPPPMLERAIAATLEEAAAERGWRLPGPIEVRLNHHEGGTAGQPTVELAIHEGARPPWGSLVGAGMEHPLTNNRVVIGRSADADVRVDHDTVSRRHALLWRSDGRVWVKDLDSANGTSLNGARVGSDVEIAAGSVLGVGLITTRLELRP